jgi:hypothetical protein
MDMKEEENKADRSNKKLLDKIYSINQNFNHLLFRN